MRRGESELIAVHLGGEHDIGTVEGVDSTLVIYPSKTGDNHDEITHRADGCRQNLRCIRVGKIRHPKAEVAHGFEERGKFACGSASGFEMNGTACMYTTESRTCARMMYAASDRNE